MSNKCVNLTGFKIEAIAKIFFYRCFRENGTEGHPKGVRSNLTAHITAEHGLAANFSSYLQAPVLPSGDEPGAVVAVLDAAHPALVHLQLLHKSVLLHKY